MCQQHFLVLLLTFSTCSQQTVSQTGSTIDFVKHTFSPATTPQPPPSSSSSSPPLPEETITLNNTRCSQTHLSFTKESLLHIWEIKGLLGYISYIKRFDQPFDLKTDHVSFKSDNVDGKWQFRVHRVRHVQTTMPFQHGMRTPSSTSGGIHGGDVRIVATYSYEAKQPRKTDFLISLTLIHGHKEIVLPPQRSASPSIVQQRFYNNRGYQLNSNYLEYVYTFTWNDVIHPLESVGQAERQYHAGPGGDEGYLSEDEYFEEITRTDPGSGHFGDVTLKFGISAYFPGEHVSVTSSRCNHSILEMASPSLLDKLTSGSASHHYHKDNGLVGNKGTPGGTPPYLRYANSMLHDDRFADVILVVEEEEIPAHRIILATSSPIFSAILENTTVFFTPNQTSSSEASVTPSGCPPADGHHNHNLPRILIEPQQGIDVATMKQLLRYIYTGTLEKGGRSSEGEKGISMAGRLIVAAETYGLLELKRLLESILLQEMNGENAMELYFVGNRVSSSRLVRKAVSLMQMIKPGWPTH